MAEEEKEKPDMVSLNVKIPSDLRRRLLIGRANTGKSIAQLVTEWIQEGLSKIERQQPRGKR